MKRIIFTLFIITQFLAASAQHPNWAEDIAPILYENCTKCHNPSGIAPFTLITYQDALTNSVAMSAAVSSGEMPPWPPDADYRHFAHERILSQAEISAITDWVTNGSISGDTTLAPAPPVYSGIAEITSPDLISQMPAYTVNATSDLYRCFVVPTGIAIQKFITEIEAIPGNRNIVHHVLIYEDTSSVPASLDAADPGPGYTNFGGTGSATSNLIGAWVPGQSVYRLPAGMGFKMRANTNIIIQVHYPAGTLSQVDSTQVRFKLVNGPLREILLSPVLNHFALDNYPFLYIPADSTRTFTAHYNVPLNVSVLSVGPHMHLIGRSVICYGVTPVNDTIPLINIPDWDFHWQGNYSFQYVQKIPAGTVLYSSAFYDNTSANPDNPNNPPQNVFLGEATTDEMMLIYFAYTLYFPGDENILIDSTLLTSVNDLSFTDLIHSPQLYEPSPNPAQQSITVQFFLPEKTSAGLMIYDMAGKLVQTESPGITNAGINSRQISLEGLPAGNYILTLNASGVVRSKKFIKEE